MNDFLSSYDSRETSPEIMQAIWQVSNHDETVANRIWEAPNEAELNAIWEIVTKNGSIPAGRFHWAWSRNQWMKANQ